ncbi:MAG TPA: response regulator, partial [Caulobacteraceae bacterium]|nr:response regulator [Caulobacteraceae bacterium]
HDDDRIAPRPARAAPTAGGARVLLAEDNPINAMLARTLLRREGAETHHVEGGEAALEALMTGDYDLILMDVRMPGLGGLEATRALRARGVETPVVALTANAFEDDRRACLEAGMDDFLIKPLSPEALRLALARWTGGGGWTRGPRRAKVDV